MGKESLNKKNAIIDKPMISQNDDNLAREKLNVLSADNPEIFLSHLVSKVHWNPNWPDWNTRGSDYGRDPKLITEQVKICKKFIKNIDSIFQRKPLTKLNKPVVEAFCKVAEHNPIIAFIAEAYKNTFSKEGKDYYEEWSQNHQNVIPKSKGFNKWMIKSLVEQRVTD